MIKHTNPAFLNNFSYRDANHGKSKGPITFPLRILLTTATWRLRQTQGQTPGPQLTHVKNH